MQARESTLNLESVNKTNENVATIKAYRGTGYCMFSAKASTYRITEKNQLREAQPVFMRTPPSESLLGLQGKKRRKGQGK
jgi:hypothetical protein